MKKYFILSLLVLIFISASCTIPKTNEECTFWTKESCDISCYTDSDCKYSGCCNCINSQETCSLKKENGSVEPLCAQSTCNCINNKCTSEFTTQNCLKENDCCTTNEDCKYFWYTGACHTTEYVSKVLEEAREKGEHIGEAQPRENVSCTCESNLCITHG